MGGLEKYASRIASAFEKRGARVTILTGRPSFYPAFIRLEQFDRYVSDWLRKTPVDLVFGMERNRFQTHLRAGNGVHAAYLQSRLFTEGPFKQWICKINPLHRKILELEKAAFENPLLQKLFTNSHWVREQVLAHYRVDPAKIQVIHNGVEWQEMADRFANWPSSRIEAFRQLNLNPHHFHFLFIGNGYLRKGLDRLLEALSMLPFRQFHLSVVGKDKCQKVYEKKAARLGLQNQVRFFGPQKEMNLFYQMADALVIPSFYDPFANVTVEALAMGLFVVSSKSNGGSEILDPGNGAIIDDLLDTDSIVAALQTALQHPKTALSAETIRQSVAHLDFSKQMEVLLNSCI